MALCDKCKYYNELYDEFRESYDDQIVDGENKKAHFCPMYADHIPFGITYDGSDCEFFMAEGGENG